MSPEDWIPELVPPGKDLMPLPPDAQPSEVIDRHLDRIASRTDVVPFNEASLLNEIVRGSQEQFDYLVAKGFYGPLSEAETQRLISTTC